uniref:Endonuclease/exonuclease/phosphatase domain-containing protein n=1 Tax=Latimeria chalumnae TaxID=7897 RepID=H3BBZ3_LATCH
PQKSKQAGVALLLHRALNFTPKETVMDPKGRFLVVLGLLDLDAITFVNIYAPNKEDPGFFAELVPILTKFVNSNLIIGGDFNLVVNPELDRSRGKISLPSKSQLALFELMSDFHLIGIWRVLHPMVKDYTFTSLSTRCLPLLSPLFYWTHTMKLFTWDICLTLSGSPPLCL